MNARDDQGLVSPSDIAELAGVSRAAVSNWRRRDLGFPQAAAGTTSKPLFSRAEVLAWLADRGHELKQDAGEVAVWAALNELRGRLSVEQSIDVLVNVAAGDPPEGAGLDAAALNSLRSALGRVTPGQLGAAVDFALERLARSQGKVGVDIGFVGSRTSKLLAGLAATRPGAVLYDPACGIGSALLEAVADGAAPSRIVGHDIDAEAIGIALKRFRLWGVSATLAVTDVLSEDLDPSLMADVIIAEPPFGMRYDSAARLSDQRFTFGVPPRASADTAWLQHAVAHLKAEGRAYVLTPQGVLGRGGDERGIRAELVRRGCVEAIVGLPGKLLPNTTIPLALWVLRAPDLERVTARILFIDASDVETPEEWVPAALTEAGSRADVPSTEVSVTEVLAADAVLAPQRWTAQHEPAADDVAAAYAQGLVEINDAIERLRNALVAFQQPTRIARSRVLTIGELATVVQVRAGRSADRYKNRRELSVDRTVTASMVRTGRLPDTGVADYLPSHPDHTNKGDLLVTTMNEIHACVDPTGGHIPAAGVYRLRVLDQAALLPGYLAATLTGSWNARFQAGTTVSRATLRDLEVPLIPLAQQREVERALSAFALLREQATHLAEQATQVGQALLDAVRYDVRLPVPLAVTVTPGDEPAVQGQDQ